MKCFSVTLGARNTPTGASRFSRQDETMVRKITARHFPTGFTILNARGGWFDAKKQRFRKEESRQILVCATQAKAVLPWCSDLRRYLGQEAVLLIELGRARLIKR
jgi:hypothetical protein